jgi:hypothetical protein
MASCHASSRLRNKKDQAPRQPTLADRFLQAPNVILLRAARLSFPYHRRGCVRGTMSDLASVLLVDAPLGEYLIEQVGNQRRLWRISEGEPPDGALEPADAWRLDRAAVETSPQPPAPLEPKPRDGGVWRWSRWLRRRYSPRRPAGAVHAKADAEAAA